MGKSGHLTEQEIRSVAERRRAERLERRRKEQALAARPATEPRSGSAVRP